VDSAHASTIAWLAALVVVGIGGCSGASRPPSELVDGSRTQEHAARLEAPTPQIRTKVAVVPLRQARGGTAARRCLAAAREHVPSGPVVVRTGVNGVSATFRTASGRALVACDGTEPDRASWCGRSFGRLDHGRLHDPRLDLACATVSGDAVAFAWFEPGPETSYVAVRQHGYVEVYRVARGAPVRITTTTGISAVFASATFEVSEHDRRGALLRATMLEARVAG
jgi:hypothetical protein